jgi:beta-lactamase regulating signal transducer with metallopeptidase domain
MNLTIFQNFFAGPLARATGWALLHLLWQAAIVAALLGVTLTLMARRSAAVRYAAACTALAILPLLAVATAWRAYESPNAATPVATSQTLSATDTVSQRPQGTALTVPAAGDLLPLEPADFLPFIVALWLSGVTFFSARLAVSWTRVRRLTMARRHEAPAILRAAAGRLAAAMRLRRAVAILESAAVEVPTVIGWIRPVILLPASALSGLSREQIEMILAHELAHIRRHDFFVNLLQTVAETLMFFHPAVWWISRQVRIEREHCCDDLAVAVCGDPVQYAHALTRLEELRGNPELLAVAASGGSLLARIRRLVSSPVEMTTAASRWTAGATLLFAVAAVLFIPSLPARAQHEPAPPPPPRHAPAPPPPVAEPATVEIDVTAPDEPEIAMDFLSADDPDLEDDLAPPPAPDTLEAEPPEPPESPESLELDAPPVPRVAAVPHVPHVRPVPHVRGVPRVHPVPAPHAMPMTDPRHAPMLAPPAMAAAMAEGIAGGIRGGIAGGIEGGIAGGIHDSIPGGIHGGIADEIHTSVDDVVRRAMKRALRAPRAPIMPPLPVIAGRPITRTPHPPRVPRAMQRQFGAAGKPSVDELVMLRTLGITPDFVAEMKSAGITGLTFGDLAALKTQMIRKSQIDELRAAGARIESAEDAIGLKLTGVDAAFIRGLAEAGYKNLSAEELMQLRMMGVTPDFIRELEKHRDRK